MNTNVNDDIQFCSQLILAALRQTDVAKLDVACDSEPTVLAAPRQFMFSLNHSPSKWNSKTIEPHITTEPYLTLVDAPTHYTIFLNINLLTLSLQFMSQNSTFSQIVDHLLLRVFAVARMVFWRQSSSWAMRHVVYGVRLVTNRCQRDWQIDTFDHGSYSCSNQTRKTSSNHNYVAKLSKHLFNSECLGHRSILFHTNQCWLCSVKRQQ